MKKILFVVLIVLQMTFVICSASADIYVNEDFNSIADNEKATNLTISGGENSRVLTFP